MVTTIIIFERGLKYNHNGEPLLKALIHLLFDVNFGKIWPTLRAQDPTAMTEVSHLFRSINLFVKLKLQGYITQ